MPNGPSSSPTPSRLMHSTQLETCSSSAPAEVVHRLATSWSLLPGERHASSTSTATLRDFTEQVDKCTEDRRAGRPEPTPAQGGAASQRCEPPSTTYPLRASQTNLHRAPRSIGGGSLRSRNSRLLPFTPNRGNLQIVNKTTT